ncbi:hypothetical protein ACLD02_12105 [Alloalcanivorax sp. C16-2]|uniref:hypothetical protein n=1 Tax=Alloalcanivorax TaxID=3020832 RepID=UPI00193386A7|nr:hypothetical protein [Alloalcanivorax marinus]MBL7251644.1 hypothetical protein [Alloalcanivorax marinus]
MLLKYLNQLDDAVHELLARPDPDALTRCNECVRVLDQYLETQMEPVARRGREIMAQSLARLPTPVGEGATPVARVAG